MKIEQPYTRKVNFSEGSIGYKMDNMGSTKKTSFGSLHKKAFGGSSHASENDQNSTPELSLRERESTNLVSSANF